MSGEFNKTCRFVPPECVALKYSHDPSNAESIKRIPGDFLLETRIKSNPGDDYLTPGFKFRPAIARSSFLRLLIPVPPEIPR